MYTKVMTSKSSSCRMPLSFKSGCGVLYHVPSVLCNVGRYEKYLRYCGRHASRRPNLRFVRIHTAICRTGTASPHNISTEANAQRTPDWTSVTTAAESHVPASPLCGVATWARWYQAPKTVKLPLWGGPRLHVGGAGAKNASCFFGRTLRNVHFGNARSTQRETFPLTQSRCLPITINHQPVIGSHQPVDQ